MAKCAYAPCGKDFTKTVAHYNENEKKGIPHFCSHACASAYGNDLKASKVQLSIDSLLSINKFRSTSSEVVGVRYLLRMSKRRGWDNDLDEVYLLRLWEEQNICPYSKIKLTMPKPSYVGKRTHNDRLFTASLDRIDSSKGYMQGNVQYVATCINYMKGSMSHEQTIEACRAIARAWSSA